MGTPVAEGPPMNPLLAPLLTTAGLIGGFGAARATGRRWLGGVLLAGVGAGTWVLVNRSAGPIRASVVTGVYLAAFGGSHPLAKRLGAWQSVYAVSGATAVIAAALAE